MGELLASIIALGFLALILLGVSAVARNLHEWVSSFDDDAAQEIEDGLLYQEQHAHQAPPWPTAMSFAWGANQHDDVEIPAGTPMYWDNGRIVAARDWRDPLCGEREVGEK